MPIARKPSKRTPEKKPASPAGHALPSPKKAAADRAKQPEYAIIGPNQLRQADLMLRRIERRNEALSANADKLLRRVS